MTGDDPTGPAVERPVVNITGELVALGALRRDLIPLYARWRNDFHVQRTFGDVPMGRTEERVTAWYEREATATTALWFTVYERATLRPIGHTDLFHVHYRNR